MKIKQLIDEDFTNYKKTSMLIGFSQCTFKCEKECGIKMCQNAPLATSPTIEIDIKKIVKRYLSNEYSQAIVAGGLEPFDTFDDLIEFIKEIRSNNCLDDIVIYTGYYKDEVSEKIKQLKQYPNIIVKFGRYIPNDKKHYDEILGIELASMNQYAERIS